ncbi:hypothetical protein ABZ725_51440 [Streptomyces sp. NPDC006872]|uniref:hypothetical protein n=1 Tax=Streptomyces sp. NPDC006872 TaxID=3155720 RepID=UPI0033FB0C5B
MERFSDEQIVHLVAWQNLYGPVTPRRWDVLLARLGMDVTAPHMRKGATPRLRDHLMLWSRADRPARSGREILGIVQGFQQQFERDDDRRTRRRGRRDRKET